MTNLIIRLLHWLLPRRIFERLVAAFQRVVYLSPDGYAFNLGTPEELEQHIRADATNAAAGQDMTDYSEFFWVLNVTGLREVFAVARHEPNDELALLTIAANTNFTVSPDDLDEDDD